MANKHKKVWKVVSRKVNSGKQTWPKCLLGSVVVFMVVVKKNIGLKI
jgi:hypothetical protein